MKLYTRKGDRGQTGILRGGRLSKSDARIRALGAVDELNAALGLVLTSGAMPAEIRQWLVQTQNDLLEAGAALASDDPAASKEHLLAETKVLEAAIDWAEEQLPPLTRFILPGGGSAGAGLHWARTLARRAETVIVAALEDEAASGRPRTHEDRRERPDDGDCGRVTTILPERVPLIMWINRLSDALFAFARLANLLAGTPEPIWEPKGAAKGSGTAHSADRGGIGGGNSVASERKNES
jgi:cob(I)alamin adenosyltransferase